MPTPLAGLRVGAGAHFARTFPNPVDDNGAPLDCSGWAGRGQIKPDPYSDTVYWTWPGSQITAGATSTTARIPVSVSALWAWTSAYYQIEVVHPTNPNSVYRVGQGVIVVDPWAITGDVIVIPGLGYGLSGYGTSGYGE